MIERGWVGHFVEVITVDFIGIILLQYANKRLNIPQLGC